MSSNLNTFVAQPQLDEFNRLKKADLRQIGQHYKLAVNSSMGKEILRNLLSRRRDFPEEDLERVTLSAD